MLSHFSALHQKKNLSERYCPRIALTYKVVIYIREGDGVEEEEGRDCSSKTLWCDAKLQCLSVVRSIVLAFICVFLNMWLCLAFAAWL